ncbi:MAG TPA: class F sortase [Streptosporangiaceae bacterium]|nr:class F sortase [Streptosporangiaceae bacterium]
MPGDLSQRPGRHISPLRVVRRPAAVAAVVCGLLVAAAGATGLALASQTGRPAAPVTKPTFVPVPLGSQEPAPQPDIAPVAKPVSITIPAIGVRSGLVRLGLASSGQLQVPSTVAVAGWYTSSARPGAIGAAVIVGHIDSRTAPGIFYRLDELRPGDKVYVRRADGTLAVFRVTSVRSYLKADFPTLAVYGPVPYAELRLITCGGSFDFTTGHYLSNTIVYASLAQ